MDVTCTNSECPEVGVPKANSNNYPVEVIRCGACGDPVEAQS